MKKSILALILIRFCRFLPFSSFLYDSISRNFRARYQTTFKLKSVALTKFNTLEFRQLILTNEQTGSILKISRIQLSFSIRNLFCLTFRARQIKADSVEISIFGGSIVKPIDVRNSENVPPIALRRYFALVFKKFLPFVESFPSCVNCSNIKVRLYRDKQEMQIHLSLNLKDEHYNLTARIYHVILFPEFNLSGTVKKEKFGKSISGFLNRGDVVLIPFFTLQKTILKFSSIEFALHIQNSRNVKRVTWFCSISDFAFEEDRSRGSLVDDISLNLQSTYDGNTFIIAKESEAIFNLLRFSPQLVYDQSKDIISFQLDLHPCTSTDILNSCKYFTLKELYTVNFPGYLTGHLMMSFRLSNPYNYTIKIDFDNQLIYNDLGELDLKYLSGSFKHVIIENETCIKEILIGKENHDFISLNELPNHLKNSVIMTEDRNFSAHSGIDQYFLGYAFITNLTERKFARGGSTITMQVARNLFLKQKKDISRKVEELIISWMLEQVFVIGKSRLLEIYFNIIEFGPGLYGIKHAAQFYFSKPVSLISLAESLVISYMIPRPKFFLEALELKSPTLRKNLKHHLEFFSREMLRTGMITEKEFNDLDYCIEFSRNFGTLCLQD